jgi:hypothetical protein
MRAGLFGLTSVEFHSEIREITNAIPENKLCICAGGGLIATF